MVKVLLILIISIVFIVVSTSRLKLHPFLALLITAYGIAFAANIPSDQISQVIADGFGSTLEGIGIIIMAGTIIGVMLERSHATVTIATAILNFVGRKRPALALSMIGYVVSIPVFCDSAFVILSSLNRSLSRQAKISIVPLAIALSTGLLAPHVLVPPTPGPIAAASNLHMDNLILVIFMGLVIAIPVVIAGYIFSIYLTKKYPYEEMSEGISGNELDTHKNTPSLLLSLAPIVVPIILMAIGTFIDMTTSAKEAPVLQIITFAGKPMNALLIGMCFSFFLMPSFNMTTLEKWVGDGLKNSATILIITGIGGALGKVIQHLPLQEYLNSGISELNLGIFLPFLIAAIMKTAQGSSTVAIITTSAIIYPLLPALGYDHDMGKTLMIMAIGAGSMTVSHANDSYFWVISQFSGMDIKTAYRTQTVATLIQGLVGMGTVYLVSFFVG